MLGSHLTVFLPGGCNKVTTTLIFKVLYGIAYISPGPGGSEVSMMTEQHHRYICVCISPGPSGSEASIMTEQCHLMTFNSHVQ